MYIILCGRTRGCLSLCLLCMSMCFGELVSVGRMMELTSAAKHMVTSQYCASPPDPLGQAHHLLQCLIKFFSVLGPARQTKCSNDAYKAHIPAICVFARAGYASSELTSLFPSHGFPNIAPEFNTTASLGWTGQPKPK